MVNPTYENYFKLIDALEALEINVTRFRSEQFINPQKSFFTHEFEFFKVDFLPEILGLEKFNSSFSNKTTAVVRGIEIHILSQSDSIKSKEKTARKKDKDDLHQLKALFSKNKNTE